MSRDDQNADKPLGDFDALFRSQQEQQDHVQTVHGGAANIEFTSVWDKKETPNAMVQTQMMANPDPMKPYPSGQINSYNQYYQTYPNMHYQPYYRPSGSDPYNQFSFGQFNASQPMAPLVNQQETTGVTSDSGYDFYQSQNVQPTYHASNVVTTPPMPKPTPPPPTLELPKFVKEEVKSEAEKNIKKEPEKDENGKPRYNSIVFANEF